MAFGIDDALGAATGIAGTVAGIIDGNKKRQFEQNLTLLTAEQTKALNERLAKASTQTARETILVNSILEYRQANQAADAKRDATRLYVLAGVGVSSLACIVYFLKD